MAAKKKEKREEYSFCQLSKSKFLIMRRVIGNTTAWSKYAEALHEPAAKHLVAILNK